MNPAAKSTEKRKELEKFADWVNPMLVKELRQGLRSKAFIGIFLGLQIILCFGFLTIMGESNNQMWGASSVGGFIFRLFSIFVVLVQPIRGVTSLSSEIKDGHMELVSLTHLRSWRVVWSKWNSIMLQSLLIFCSLLPFIFVRYFFGGMDVLAEFMRYILAIGTSGVLVAMMISISACKFMFLRWLLIFGMAVLALRLLNWLFDPTPYGLFTTGAFTPSWAFLGEFTALLFGAGYVIYLTLMAAVRSIAPVAENHSTVFRLVTLSMIILFYVIATLTGYFSSEYYLMLFLSVVAILGFYCLTESGAEVETYLSIKRREHFPFHGWLTAPGWQFGFWAFTLGVLIAGGFSLMVPPSDLWEQYAGIGSFTAMALFPLIILPLMKRQVSVVTYLAVILIVFAITLVLALGIDDIPGLKSQTWLAWIAVCFPPTGGAFYDVMDKAGNEIPYAVGILCMCLLYWFIVAFMSITSIRKQLRERGSQG